MLLIRRKMHKLVINVKYCHELNVHVSPKIRILKPLLEVGALGVVKV